MKSTSLALLLLALTLQAAFADPALTLRGVDGNDHSPLVAGNKKGVVLFFVSAYCPTSNTFVKEMNQITADYGDKFVFSFVHSDSDQKLPDILQHTEMNEIKAQVLLDKEQTLAKQMQAKITPEVVLLGADGKTIYQGRINDLYLGPTKRQRQATTKDLRDALDAVIAGKSIATPKTEAMGCKISGLK
jgi:thioredoxin-related protein